MQKIPAHLGWHWIKEGFALFRKQPMAFLTFFLSYFFLLVGFSIVPVLGQILPLILIPVFSMAFMQACVDAEQGKPVHPGLLLAIFRSPVFLPLLKLGGLYLLAIVIALASSSLIDGGIFWLAITGQIKLDSKTVNDSNLSLGMLFSTIVYTPAMMGLWYAAPLIAWKNMSIGKAIFYSFYSVRRAGKAFLVYGFAWIAIGILLPAMIVVFVTLLTNQAILTTLMMLSLSIVLTTIMYCSFYPTYTAFFGKPESSV
jgi:hypothetical protein